MPTDSHALSPLWHHTAAPLADRAGIHFGPGCDRLSEAVDTLVIGAGVTGLSTALHLAERGARVRVLDRQGPGLGTTGRANGQVIAGLQLGPDALLAAFGAEQGERLIEFCGKGPDLLFDLIARHRIACDAERSGWVQATRASGQLKSLEALAEAWFRRGAPVATLGRDETAQVLGTDAYAGSWLDRRNGTVQPLAYARGLAAAAAGAGAIIHGDVEVTGLSRHDRQWRIATTRGEARAETVVLATNVDTETLRGRGVSTLGRSYLSAYSVQLASEPLDESQLRTLLPQRHSCGDTGHARLRYFRLDREGRFVIGGPGWLTAPRSAGALSFRILEASARRMFPQLGNTRFAYRWSAHDTLTADLLPHLCEPDAGLFSALGFNGRGLAIGTALGSVLARRVLGEPANALPYPTTTTRALPATLPAAAALYLRVALTRLRHRVH